MFFHNYQGGCFVLLTGLILTIVIIRFFGIGSMCPIIILFFSMVFATEGQVALTEFDSSGRDSGEVDPLWFSFQMVNLLIFCGYSCWKHGYNTAVSDQASSLTSGTVSEVPEKVISGIVSEVIDVLIEKMISDEITEALLDSFNVAYVEAISAQADGAAVEIMRVSLDACF
jgi:hypothetical protein